MPQLFAFLGAAAISFSAIFVRLADTSPATAAFFRMAYALPPLLLLWWATRGGDARSPRRRGLAFAAGALMGASIVVWNHAIPLIGAGLSTVIGNTQVVYVGIAAWLLFGERPSRTAFAAIPLVLLGVVLASGLGRAGAYGEAPLLGALLAALNAAVYAAALLLFRSGARGPRWPSGPQLEATVGAFALTLAAGLLTDPGFALAPAWPAHGWLALLALGSQVVGWFCISVALPRLPALQTSVILLLQPALAVLWGLLIFDEILSPLQWLGVAAVLLGIGVVSAAGASRRARGRSPAARPATVDGAPRG